MAEVSAQSVKELRERTGTSVMECKKALVESSGDIQKALDYLKHRGVKLAEKKQGKTTTAGRVGSYIHSNGKVGVLVELGCETDFVANNEEFKELLHEISLQIAAMNPIYVCREEIPPEVITKEKEYFRKEVLEQQQKEGKEKPAAVTEKIIDGKIEKIFYTQRCLLEQAFVKDDAKKIQDLIKDKIAKFGENIVVKRFRRFEIGKE
ncbi:MAG: translation elongation factor Ts [Planctomycetes bacterium]|nr:translation elongation factor Ts [Planctomycetota bacterium]